ncbi:trypsin-like serine protease [Pseudoalteromonas sp. C2R02]|uniref:serine protease n=1 Tax=Pseudoalteromonas sp. C2R02 TaxID=2841565 RepID=UPI001C09BEA1|nr:serine protease [Pseudoalteromonas sp. C2R02]MBU2968557.1 trypsin-like serine protease [Pseudoalteromonas sp. C2R02]
MNKQHKITLGLLAGLMTQPLLAVSDKQIRIVNGDNTQLNAYPFMTSLYNKNADNLSQGHSCGSSFIGGRYVLTASHCIEGANAKDLAVWIGGHDLTKETQGKSVDVAQIYMHEEYGVGGETNNDMAILELVSEVSNATPIKLITEEIFNQIKVGDDFTVMGWGALEEGGQSPSILQEVKVPYITHEQCNAADWYNGDITEQMICAGYEQGNKDSCQGDSGGPLIYKHEDEFYQLGVVSWGDGCANAKKPGVYANVIKFIDWVKQKRAGVSYQQSNGSGYVEFPYKEIKQVEMKNVGSQTYSVTGIEILDGNNTVASVSSNGCDTKLLATGDACKIDIEITNSEVGESGFSLKVMTNHPDNNQALMYFSALGLEASNLAMDSLVGSNEHIKWYSGADAVWEAQTDKVTQGDSAVSSGEVEDSQRSVLLAVIDNPKAEKLSYKYLVSSEYYDDLSVTHNNNRKLLVFGTDQTEFESQELALEPGKNRIAFIYTKDQLETEGEDKGYIDEIALTIKNTAPIAKVAQESITVKSGGQITIDAKASTDEDGDTLTFEWAEMGTDLTSIADKTKGLTTVKVPKVKKDTHIILEVTVKDTVGAVSKKQIKVLVKKQKRSGGSSSMIMFVLLAGFLTRKSLKLKN